MAFDISTAAPVASGGFDISTAQPVGQATTPEMPQDKGFFQRVGDRLNERRRQGNEIALAVERGDQSTLEGAFQTGGKVIAGSAFDILGEGLNSIGHGISAITPDAIKEPIKNAARMLPIVSPNVGKAIDLAKSGVNSYEEFSQEHPRAARNIEAATNMGLLLAPTKVGNMANEAAVKTAAEKPTEAFKKVLQAFKRDKLTPSDLLNRLDELGPEATIADVGGENVKALARATAALPGPGKEIATKFLNERQLGQSARVSGQVSKSLGAGELFYNNVDDLLAARKEASQPLYEQVIKGSNKIPNQDFKPIANDDFIMGVMDKIKSDPLYKMGGLQNNSMPMIDATKKYIDRVIYSAKRGNNPNNYEVSRLVDKSQKLRDIADNTFPRYATARDAFAGPTQLVDALENGRAFIRGDAEATKDTLSKLSESEQQFFRIGAARALRDKVLNTPDTADTVKKIFNTPLMRDKLEAVFPNPKEFSDFEKMMNNEATLFQTRSAVLSGSRTAPLQSEMSDTVANVATNGKIALDLAQGNIGNVVRGVARKFSGPQTLKPEVSQDLANLLFTKRQDNKKVLNAILSRNPKQIGSYAYGDVLDNPITKESLAATGIQVYQQQATDLKQKLENIKANTELTNRQRKQQLEATKSDMQDLFKQASKNLELQDFRNFRKHVNNGL